MNDTPGMCGLQGQRDLPTYIERLRHRQRSAREPFRQSLARNQLHCEERQGASVVSSIRSGFSMPESVDQMVTGFEQMIRDAQELLAKLTDEDLARKKRFRIGDKTLANLSKRGFLRTVMLNHAYHHRGQLSVYLRLLNVPVPPIYGPMADEGL